MNAVHEEFPSLVRVSLTFFTAVQAGVFGTRTDALKVDLKKAGLLKPAPTRLDVMQLPPVLQPATMQDLQSILGGTQGLQNVLGGAPPPNMSMAPMDPAMNPLMPNPTIVWKNYN